jgi:dimethylargininase
MAWLALTREISPAIDRCELTHLARRPIDLERARRQHADYEDALARLGCRVVRLAADADLPDAVFVEDTAVVVDECAVITRPGAKARRGEVDAVAVALAAYRRLTWIEAPATIDGGDVIVAGRRVFVGETPRTSAAGVEALRRRLEPHGYVVSSLPVTGCLHLKSAATALDPETILVNRQWVDAARFDGMTIVEVDSEEPGGANVLTVGRTVLAASEAPRTVERLKKRGYDVVTVDNGELAKAEGAITCGSLIFRLPD